jgi:hypothetical protein
MADQAVAVEAEAGSFCSAVCKRSELRRCLMCCSAACSLFLAGRLALLLVQWPWLTAEGPNRCAARCNVMQHLLSGLPRPPASLYAVYCPCLQCAGWIMKCRCCACCMHCIAGEAVSDHWPWLTAEGPNTYDAQLPCSRDAVPLPLVCHLTASLAGLHQSTCPPALRYR